MASVAPHVQGGITAVTDDCQETVAAEARLESYNQNFGAYEVLEDKKTFEGLVIIRLESHSYTTGVHILSSYPAREK